MKAIYCFFIALFILCISCEKLKRHDIVKGSIKDLITKNPVSNQEFKLTHSTSKYGDEYNSSTDNDGNYSVKTIWRKDYTVDKFIIKNCYYNSRVSENLEQFYDFYIHEGQLYSKSNLTINFTNNTTLNDTLIIKLGIDYKYFFKEVTKKFIGPFPTNFNFIFSDTVENLSTHKSDGIYERNLNWKFRNQSGSIQIKDNYITGIGCLDSVFLN